MDATGAKAQTDFTLTFRLNRVLLRRFTSC